MHCMHFMVNPIIRHMDGAQTSLRVDVRTRNLLKKLKQEGESYDDVIRKLVSQQNRYSDEHIAVVSYKRKTSFVQTKTIGIEYTYNDIIGLTDYTFDLRITKIYTQKDVRNPSVYFGVSHEKLFQNKTYLETYLLCLTMVFKEALKVNAALYDVYKNNTISKDIVAWKQLYVDNDMSEESFKVDVLDYLKKAHQERLK